MTSVVASASGAAISATTTGQRERRSSAYALAGTGYQRDLIGQI
jgi:hypothetical protein